MRFQLGIRAQLLNLVGVLHAPACIVQSNRTRNREINGAEEIVLECSGQITGQRRVSRLRDHPKFWGILLFAPLHRLPSPDWFASDSFVRDGKDHHWSV